MFGRIRLDGMRRRPSAALMMVVAAMAVFAGCAPTLYEPTRNHHYRAKALCSQGPLEFTLEATGARWGESVQLAAHGPRDLAGFFEVHVDGKLVRRGAWGQTKEIFQRTVTAPPAGSVSAGTGPNASGPTVTAASSTGQQPPSPSATYSKTGVQAVAGPDNRRCLAAAPGAEAGSGAPAAPARSGSTGKMRASKARGTPVKEPQEESAAPSREGGPGDTGLEKADWEAQLKKWPDTVFRFPILPTLGRSHDRSSCYSEHLGPRNPWPRGARIVIRLWSSQPNDLEDVVFSLGHQQSFGSKEWEKHQKKAFRACLRKHPAQKKRWETLQREKRRRDALAAKSQRPLAQCIQYLPVLLQDPQGRPYRVSVTRPCFCFRNPRDETCWGSGGQEGFQKRLAEAPPTEGFCYAQREVTRWGFTKRVVFHRPCRCFRNLNDVPCWGKAGYPVFEQDEFDKAFAQPCGRGVWIERRVAVPSVGRGKASRGARPLRAAQGPRPSAGEPPLPARYLYEIERPCPCFGKLKDVSCWGQGGYDGMLGRLRLALPSEGVCMVHHRTPHPTRPGVTWLLPVKKPCSCFGKSADEACWGKGGRQAFLRELEARYQKILTAEERADPKGRSGAANDHQEDLERKQLEADKRALQVERERAEAERRYQELHARETASRPARPTPAPGVDLKLPPKPPPPRQEAPPDPPSKNAVWIPGYWHRGGKGGSERWHWISGWWRVPPSDVKAGLTAKADRPPPAPKHQAARPTAPAPEAVWVPGYWHWHGGGFVWIEGRWTLPPARGHRWRPAGWRLVRGGAVFLPGGWIPPRR